MARDLADGAEYVYGRGHVDQRERPYSTFKVPNLLIALDSGTAQSLDDKREWDSTKRPAASYWPKSWRHGQTLETAFRRSVVWYFQDLALAIGGPRYRDELGRYRYGNALVPDGNDRFWLDGPLAISPREQVMFLVALVSRELLISDSAFKALERVSRVGAHQTYALHGKTGSGPDGQTGSPHAFAGWFVGWVTRAGQPRTAFALFTRGPDYASIRHFRRQMAERLLIAIGALPENWPR